MTIEVLPEASFELDGVTFGPGSATSIQDVDFGDPELTVGDLPRPRADGMMFGRDYRGGRLVTFELTVLTAYTAPAVAALPELGGYGTVATLDELALLNRAWSGGLVRTTPGAVSRLRYRLGGRQRVLYGRPRKFAATSGWATLGRVPVSATFQAIDHRFYDDVERTAVVPYIPPPAGGLTFPIEFPWSTITVGYSPGVIAVAGTEPSWLVIVIYGPIVNPAVTWVGGDWTLGLNLSLLDSQFVVIDPRPWSRGVRLDGVTNVAGALTPTSPRLSELELPFGTHEIVLSGQDDTGLSSMTLAWRHAYSSF
jgi:hypothetical protein